METEKKGHALKGWVRLANLRPGAVFVTRDGIKAVKTEYRYANNNPQPMCILLESGEYAHFPALDREWVKEITVLNLEYAGTATVEEAPGDDATGA